MGFTGRDYLGDYLGDYLRDYLGDYLGDYQVPRGIHTKSGQESEEGQ